MTAHHPSVPGVTFKDIDGFPGYCVGDDGSVWSSKRRGRRLPAGVTWQPLKPTIDKHGYGYIGLCCGALVRRFYVHALLLRVFVGPCPDGMECRHLDGDRTNNRLSNLTWGTRLENSEDRSLHGTQHRGAPRRLDEFYVRAIRRMYAAGGHSQPQIAKAFGVSVQAVENILTGRTWKHVS